MLLADGESQILILQGEDWHPGVVGIVASRMVDSFHLPTFCLALDGNIWKGSGRSIPGVNLKELLDSCAETLMRFGGHVAAAGLTLAPEKLESFRALAQKEVARIRDTETETAFALDIDLAIKPNELSFEMVSMLERAGPFGHENPIPTFLMQEVRTSGRIIGKKIISDLSEWLMPLVMFRGSRGKWVIVYTGLTAPWTSFAMHGWSHGGGASD